MDVRDTDTRPRSSTSCWSRLRRGPWPEEVVDRLLITLDKLAKRLRTSEEVVGLILFGSYARGQYGRKSDVDLLVVLDTECPPEDTKVGRAALRLCGELEIEQRLPMHLAPLLVGVDRAPDLGPTLLHALWTDGVVLYGCASALARLQPTGLAPWTVIHFSTTRLPAADRVRLSRRLHGMGKNPGIVRPLVVILGRGTILAPSSQSQSIQDALDTAGASYEAIPIWREGS
jgi:predicted nucleotidyltransferase